MLITEKLISKARAKFDWENEENPKKGYIKAFMCGACEGLIDGFFINGVILTGLVVASAVVNSLCKSDEEESTET